MKQMLLDIFVNPLFHIYGAIYTFFPDVYGEGVRIVCFSLFLNLLLMPVYAQMERKSRAASVLRERVSAEVARMKRHFRGRELYFYIRAVHRQFGYRPISHLLGSADLLVQIVVFATVYRFLSGLGSLHGAQFGLLHDLGQPDALIAGINVLPLIMTAINAAAVLAYVNDQARRVQALALALLFLVLLYSSPAGLVLYWITNNLFSLLRTHVQKQRASRPPQSWARLLAELERQR